VGVVVEIGDVLMSKNSKKYRVLKVTDLQKYDLFRVKKHLEQEAAALKDPLLAKIAEKSFNNNGYKLMKLMAFEEAMLELTKFQVGNVIGLVNPKPLKGTVEHGFTFIMDAAASLFKIGHSEELGFCKPTVKMANMTTSGLFNPMGSSSCRHFLNKSIETMCDTHKSML
jgi:hypothetical protein